MDLVNFGETFSMHRLFQCRYNPCHPIVALKFNRKLWIVLLPGKRRQQQGLILYHYQTYKEDQHFETCQWSPKGGKLLLIVKGEASTIKPIWMNSKPYYRADLFVLEDARGRYRFREIKNLGRSVPWAVCPQLLSSEI